MQNILPSAELRKFTKGETIYKMGSSPSSVFLVIKGEVIFEMKIEFPARKKSITLKLS